MTDTRTTAETQLEIGQVIYCISNENGVVYPVQVIEEVVHKSISGTKKSYTVRLDLFDESGTVSTQLLSLDGLQDRWFPTLESAKQFLADHFNSVIDQLIENAEKLSVASFAGGVENATVVSLQKPSPSETGKQITQQATVRKKPTVTLLDGTVVELDQIE